MPVAVNFVAALNDSHSPAANKYIGVGYICQESVAPTVLSADTNRPKR
jgi:hypothetical protein